MSSIKVDGNTVDANIHELVNKRFLSSTWPVIEVKNNIASVEFVFKPEGKQEESYMCELKTSQEGSSGVVDVEYRNEEVKCGSFLTYDEFMDAGNNS